MWNLKRFHSVDFGKLFIFEIYTKFPTRWWSFCFCCNLWWVFSYFDWTIGPSNGLVPSGNKPLPDPMLSQISVAIWRQYATMSSTLRCWSLGKFGGMSFNWNRHVFYACMEKYNDTLALYGKPAVNDHYCRSLTTSDKKPVVHNSNVYGTPGGKPLWINHVYHIWWQQRLNITTKNQSHFE